MNRKFSDKEESATIYSTNELFPKRLKVHKYNSTNDQLYRPLEYCFIDVVLNKDEPAIIGSSHCSLCKHSIDLISKYCPTCGAKVKKKRLLRRKTDIYEESSNSESISTKID